MPVGSLDRQPPRFFHQGPSALSKLTVLAALALLLMVADVRWRMVDPLRAAVATALYPLQRVLLVPVDMVRSAASYVQGLHAAQQAAQAANTRLSALSERANRAEQLAIENARLRALLELGPALQAQTLAAEVLYEAADPYSRRVTLNRGSQHGLVAGSPVVNEAGVLGQVTRVFPLTAEATLLVDKDAAIPVVNTRTRQRSVVYGGADRGSRLELRYLSVDTDVEVGDPLQTGGLDGVYPAGLAVGTVTGVIRRPESGFARVQVQPAAAIEGVRHVLLLAPLSDQMPARRPEPETDEVPAERQLTTPKRTGKIEGAP